MTAVETTAELYDRSAGSWERRGPVLLSDFTARPAILRRCDPIEGAEVLDLGCGEGYVARQLKERGAKLVDGIDVSAEMIRAAQDREASEQLGIDYAVGDACQLELDREYDLVVAVFLFNYLTREQTIAAMKAVYRALRPGGRFIFAVPHPSLPFVREEQPPFYFSRGSNGYFSARDEQLEGRIWRRDGESVPVRCVHKTLTDYFAALSTAGFSTLPELEELHALPEHFELDPQFFGPLRDQPLHLMFQITKEG